MRSIARGKQVDNPRVRIDNRREDRVDDKATAPITDDQWSGVIVVLTDGIEQVGEVGIFALGNPELVGVDALATASSGEVG